VKEREAPCVRRLINGLAKPKARFDAQVPLAESMAKARFDAQVQVPLCRKHGVGTSPWKNVESCSQIICIKSTCIEIKATPIVRSSEATYLLHEAGYKEGCLILGEMVVLALEGVKKGFKILHSLQDRQRDSNERTEIENKVLSCSMSLWSRQANIKEKMTKGKLRILPLFDRIKHSIQNKSIEERSGSFGAPKG
jgi:hypothetical protein